MSSIAANLEWLFAEAGETAPDRIRAAAAHGIDAVEIWGWRDKDPVAIQTALEDTGVTLLSLVVDPQLQITDPTTHEEYLSGVRDSLVVARMLGAPNLVVAAGNERPGVPREEQRAAVVTVLRAAARLAAEANLVLLLEPLNTKVDHVGTFLSSTREGLEIVEEVGFSNMRLLLDAYHALMMDEDLAEVIGGDVEFVGHVQIADAPGRHEPGTGTIDWDMQLRTLRRLGYTGYWGMEYVPSADTVASLVAVEQISKAVEKDMASSRRSGAALQRGD